jgi:hypothetical protein
LQYALMQNFLLARVIIIIKCSGSLRILNAWKMKLIKIVSFVILGFACLTSCEENLLEPIAGQGVEIVPLARPSSSLDNNIIANGGDEEEDEDATNPPPVVQ